MEATAEVEALQNERDGLKIIIDAMDKTNMPESYVPDYVRYLERYEELCKELDEMGIR